MTTTQRVAEVTAHGRAPGVRWVALARADDKRRIVIRVDTITAWLYDQAAALLVIHTRDGRYDPAPDPDRRQRPGAADPMALLDALLDALLWDELVGAT